MTAWALVAWLVFGSGAAAEACPPADDGWLRERMQADRRFARVLRDAEGHRLQVLVAEVRVDAEGRRSLVRHGYRVDAEYFYPASAIKTFASVAALRVLAGLPPGPAGERAGPDTPLALCRIGSERCAVDRDESNREGGAITVRHEIRKIQLVSDNGAFNRLYDLVGYAGFGERLPAMGFADVRVEHRLSTGEPEALHRTTPALELRAPGHTWTIAARTGEARPANVRAGTQVGAAHGAGAEPGPIEFATHNAAPLCALQRLTLALVLPELTSARLGLAEGERGLLVSAMGEDPRASSNPRYGDPGRSIDRFKPMLKGIARVVPRRWVRYVNKAGKAYGFHVENAYVEDTRTGRAFLVAATIYADDDGVIDDDRYDYAAVTGPFYAALGELLARELLAEARR